MRVGREQIADVQRRQFETIILEGSLQSWDADHRAKILRTARWVFKYMMGLLFGAWLLGNSIALMFAPGCRHGACAQPDWWPSWVLLPSRLFLRYIETVAQ